MLCLLFYGYSNLLLRFIELTTDCFNFVWHMYFSSRKDVYGYGNWSPCLLLMAVVTLYYIPNCVHSLIHALCQL